jgi:TonB family protein
MVLKYLLISVLFFSVSLVAPKKKTCDTDNTKRLYETAVEHYKTANYAAAIKCLDICIDCFSLNVEARVLRIQVNKKLNYMEPACEDLNVLRSFGAEAADSIMVPNCKDEIRWWKQEPAKPASKSDTLQTAASNDSIEPVKEKIDTTLAETLPVYPGGESAMMNDLLARITYPVDCKENNISGSVIMEFVVEKDGRISNIEVVRKIPNGRSLEMTAYNALLNLRKFAPATQNNKPVRCKMRIPVNFKLR